MIERTLDYRRVKKIVEWPLTISREIIYLIDVKDGKDLGVWSFFKNVDGSNSYVIHADLGAMVRGRKAIESAKAAFKWIFDNTKIDFIIASVEKHRKDVCYMAVYAGMESLGINGDFKNFKLLR